MKIQVVLLSIIAFISISYPQAKNQKTLKPELVFVEGGTFTMGNNDEESSAKPIHQVTVDSFLIGKYEVTQELWESVMGTNPSTIKNGSNPVEQVSWYDVIKFCNKLSEKEGLKKAYSGDGDNITCDFRSNGYRLPTEAEWEYAAKGGNKSKGYKYSGSNNIDLVAWYEDNSKAISHPAGKMQPNELGLYDMTGNVWEWCWDLYGDYTANNQKNPKGPIKGGTRVTRGGSYLDLETVDVTLRGSHDPYALGNGLLGFRLARSKN